MGRLAGRVGEDQDRQNGSSAGTVAFVDRVSAEVGRFFVGSDRGGELVEGGSGPELVEAGIDAELVVAAPQVLHEGVTLDDHRRRVVASQAAHRPQPGLEPSVICLDRVVRMSLNGVQG